MRYYCCPECGGIASTDAHHRKCMDDMIRREKAEDMRGDYDYDDNDCDHWDGEGDDDE